MINLIKDRSSIQAAQVIYLIPIKDQIVKAYLLIDDAAVSLQSWYLRFWDLDVCFCGFFLSTVHITTISRRAVVAGVVHEQQAGAHGNH